MEEPPDPGKTTRGQHDEDSPVLPHIESGEVPLNRARGSARGYARGPSEVGAFDDHRRRRVPKTFRGRHPILSILLQLTLLAAIAFGIYELVSWIF
jgi:hypothetical protein